MARTAVMRLLELMVMKEDIRRVIEYLGKKGNFEFQDGLGDGNSSASFMLQVSSYSQSCWSRMILSY